MYNLRSLEMTPCQRRRKVFLSAMVNLRLLLYKKKNVLTSMLALCNLDTWIVNEVVCHYNVTFNNLDLYRKKMYLPLSKQ